jgi:hypothetical protein
MSDATSDPTKTTVPGVIHERIIAAHKWHQEATYKSMIKISLTIMQFILVANGGAAVALLTFLGSLAEHEKPLPNFTASLAWFLAGVSAGGLMAGAAYVTQFCLFQDRRPDDNSHLFPLRVTVAFAAIGIFCFLAGSYVGADVLRDITPVPSK